MSKKQQQTEQAIKRYEELLRQKKSYLNRQKAKVRVKAKLSARKSREYRIYQLGGMVVRNPRQAGP